MQNTSLFHKSMAAENPSLQNLHKSSLTSNSNWCEPRDHVVTQSTIKIEIWSRKTEIGLIGVWHNGNLPQGTNTIGLSRMTPW
jgi:hypothetical protein